MSSTEREEARILAAMILALVGEETDASCTAKDGR
jgi:hypothetical protein